MTSIKSNCAEDPLSYFNTCGHDSPCLRGIFAHGPATVPVLNSRYDRRGQASKFGPYLFIGHARVTEQEAGLAVADVVSRQGPHHDAHSPGGQDNPYVIDPLRQMHDQMQAGFVSRDWPADAKLFLYGITQQGLPTRLHMAHTPDVRRVMPLFNEIGQHSMVNQTAFPV